jgi:hypothetical protein
MNGNKKKKEKKEMRNIPNSTEACNEFRVHSQQSGCSVSICLLKNVKSINNCPIFVKPCKDIIHHIIT